MGTHWRKNNDTKFIRGEELQHEINGFKKSMNVKIMKIEDEKSFDPSTNQETIVSAIFMKELGGEDLKKPTILNATAGKFLEKEFKSMEIEDYIGKEVTLHSVPHKRHDYVVRFMKYIKPTIKRNTATFTQYAEWLKQGGTIEAVKELFIVPKDIEDEWTRK
jgi:hypothetical protein